MKYIKPLILISSLLIVYNMYGWQKQSINFEPSFYKGGTQNWQIKQASNGWMYFANNDGLLEFDGYTWSIYPMQNKSVKAIEIDNDIIYAGGNNVFGYYTENENAILEFHSLSTQLERWKGYIWNIFKYKENVFFIDDYNIYVFKKLEYEYTIKSSVKINCSLLYQDKIYLGNDDKISYLNLESKKIQNTEYTDLPKTSHSKQFKIIDLLIDNKDLIAATSHSGIFKETNKKLTPISFYSGNDFIAKNQIFCMAAKDTLFALGSVQNGLLLLNNKQPHTFDIINQDNILRNNTILSCFFDRNSNLWIGLDNGIAFIDLNTFISPLFNKESPIGTGYCSINYNGNIYLGTNQGLYILSKNNSTPELIREGTGQIISLKIIDNSLFSCGDNNILVIQGNKKYSINIKGVNAVYPVAGRKNILIAATYFGFKILKWEDGIWKYSHDIQGAINPNKGGFISPINNEYWQANPDDDFITQITFNNDFTSAKNTKYSLGKNKVVNNSTIIKIDDQIVICTEKGLLRYSSDNNSFVPYKELEELLDGSQVYQYLQVDDMNNIWYKVNGSLKVLPHSTYRVHPPKFYVGFESEMINGSENIAMIDSINAIVPTYKGFSLVNTEKLKNKRDQLYINIRELKVQQDSTTLRYGKSNDPISISYGRNNILISWGGLETSSQGKIQFKYKLEGLDNDWSIATENHTKEYTNLKEGSYKFIVKAVIDGQDISETLIDEISFIISPPWYRTNIAYLIYILVVGIVCYYLYKTIVRKKEKLFEKKRKKIEYQRLLLTEENRIKDKKIYEQKKNQLENDLQYKSYEMSGYLLNITRKNEILDKIKRESGSILKIIDTKGDTLLVRNKISDLIKDINRNVKDDDYFKVFKSNFDFVHKDFFKALENLYPQLTQKEKVLCAYIKLNLSSKEIAPLLNISVRGVEINRYNLRKKMNLDRNINLSEYLNNL